MKNQCFCLIVLLLFFKNTRAQTVEGQSWFSYGNTAMGGYSWTNAALTTNSIEIVNNNGQVSHLSPTLAFHHYGSGGPQFRLAADGSNILYLESSGANSARNPNPYGGGPNNYFTRLHIDASLTTTGNLGIGTVSPNVKLQVNCDNNGTGGANWIAGNIGGTSGDRVVVGILNGVATIGSHNNALNAWSNLAINPDSYGNVSIGTADAKGYRLAINGGVIATAVTVKTSGSWPDYVFAPSYHLPSLTEIEAYVNRNRHLPEMPSASEVDKRDVNLGEMNKLLVKKVEELTLYLIAEHENNRQQQAQINRLNRKLQALVRPKNKKVLLSKSQLAENRQTYNEN